MESGETFVEDFLEHYGVKGMKWGVRRDQALLDRIAGRRNRAVGGTRQERKAANKKAKQDWKDYKSSTTRQERRSDRKAAIESKANFILDKALNSPTTLFEIHTPGNVKTLTTGKALVDHLSAGGAFSPVYTDISDIRLGSPKYNPRS